MRSEQRDEHFARGLGFGGIGRAYDRVKRAHALADLGRWQSHRSPPKSPEGDAPARVRERPDAAASATRADAVIFVLAALHFIFMSHP
jgi:hypothetical protein